MSDAIKFQQGFSLVEVLISVVLLITVITALAGGSSHLTQSFIQMSQYRQTGRDAWVQAQQSPPTYSGRGQLNRMQTMRQRCVSITVTITMPAGRLGELSRLHCPKN